MKKSVVLKQIADYLHREYGVTYNNGVEESLMRATAILDICEDSGMLPPFDTELYHRIWRNTDDNAYVWEKE